VGVILLLVFLPIVIAIASFVVLGSPAAALMFLFLSAVVVFGGLHMARVWDEGEPS
jgi:hypothetical protein